MPKPRKSQLFQEEPPDYHGVSRCVRRAFLCGVNSSAGKNHGHRRQWIVNCMKSLADLFAIDIYAYSLLHNHYHVILHVDTERAVGWSDLAVIERCGASFRSL